MKILLFGATGSAGGSVLQACLAASKGGNEGNGGNGGDVEEVRAVVRRPLRIDHPRLRVTVHGDYLDYAPIAEVFDGVDACLWCLGISATQVPVEADYRVITRDFAMAAARMLKERSPGAVFHYLSGQGAALDSRMMWARVKAEAERDLGGLGPAIGPVCWRPAFIDGADAASTPRLFQALRPVFRLLKPFRSLYVSGEDIGRAMLQATREGLRGRTIGNAEIRDRARR